VVHEVKKGETIYRLSRYYGVSVRDIVRANDVRDVSAVPIGTRLVIPSAQRNASGDTLALAAVSAFPPSVPASPSARQRETDLDFRWPLKGKLSSRYGWRRGRSHEGIDIAAPRGTQIRAAESGRVTHSGWLAGYGRVVILKHSGRYSTVYAHNRKNLVRKGAFVEKGQVVGEVGSTGRATGPHVHFEIRRDRKPKDPLAYLP
jgi:murein DD-endopeptidase MepM/ murein hydrolase activator NlpD